MKTLSNCFQNQMSMHWHNYSHGFMVPLTFRWTNPLQSPWSTAQCAQEWIIGFLGSTGLIWSVCHGWHLAGVSTGFTIYLGYCTFLYCSIQKWANCVYSSHTLAPPPPHAFMQYWLQLHMNHIWESSLVLKIHCNLIRTLAFIDFLYAVGVCVRTCECWGQAK